MPVFPGASQDVLEEVATICGSTFRSQPHWRGKKDGGSAGATRSPKLLLSSSEEGVEGFGTGSPGIRLHQRPGKEGRGWGGGWKEVSLVPDQTQLPSAAPFTGNQKRNTPN